MPDKILFIFVAGIFLVLLAARQILTRVIKRGSIAKQYRTPYLRFAERALQIFWAFTIAASLLADVSLGRFFTIAWLQYAGLALLVAAVVLQTIAKWQLGSNWTNAAEGATAREGPITTRGLYRWSRNPMYCGTILETFALVFVLQNFVAVMLCCGTFFYVLRNIKNEERLLLEVKGELYERYLAGTPRFFWRW